MRQPFEQCVSEHGGLVLRVCRAVLGPVDADDAWSETFLSALRAWPDLPDDADVRAWLVTIAHRKAIDVIRARGRAPIPVPVPPERPDPGSLDGTPLPDDGLWRALAELPPKQRLCVAYHHVAGFAHPEVAALLGGTAAAARRASADGIAALRRTYAPSLERETHA